MALTASSLMTLFREQEDSNCHSENALLLAERFGTRDEVEAAKRAIQYRDENGGYPGGCAHINVVRDLQFKYFPALAKAAEDGNRRKRRKRRRRNRNRNSEENKNSDGHIKITGV